MAQGDLVVFDQFIEDVGGKVHDLDADVIKASLVDSVITPSASTSDPRWGSGGSTNLDTNEVTAGGNYTAEGEDISATWSQTSGTGTFDATDISVWTQNASNPTDARWLIIYNSTSSGKECIAFVDLGAIYDMTTGDLNVTWNASGIFTIA